MTRALEYTVLDVFAERPLEGNPLAVFHDGRGLTDDEMQALARETNLSETTFILPSDAQQDREQGTRVRIFTTQEELPFAGHPTLGTAAWLWLNEPGLHRDGAITLRLKVGAIPVSFPRPAVPATFGIYGSMRQLDPEFGSEHDPGDVAEVLGLSRQDLLPGSSPQTVSTGNAFCITALRSVEVLGALAIPQREAVSWLRARGIRWFYCIAPDPGTGGWRARMQWHGGEDPATGSAAGCCISWLVRTGLVVPDTPTTLLQGVEMQRPSRLTTQASRRGDDISGVFVAGRTIPVATGRFLLPH